MAPSALLHDTREGFRNHDEPAPFYIRESVIFAITIASLVRSLGEKGLNMYDNPDDILRRCPCYVPLGDSSPAHVLRGTWV